MGGALIEHQLTFATAAAHKAICLQLGMGDVRSMRLAVIYDEVARWDAFCAQVFMNHVECDNVQEVLGQASGPGGDRFRP